MADRVSSDRLNPAWRSLAPGPRPAAVPSHLYRPRNGTSPVGVRQGTRSRRDRHALVVGRGSLATRRGPPADAGVCSPDLARRAAHRRLEPRRTHGSRHPPPLVRPPRQESLQPDRGVSTVPRPRRAVRRKREDDEVGREPLLFRARRSWCARRSRPAAIGRVDQVRPSAAYESARWLRRVTRGRGRKTRVFLKE